MWMMTQHVGGDEMQLSHRGVRRPTDDVSQYVMRRTYDTEE